ncbi:MAG TPA: hypothetical protein VJL84_08335, partial [Kiloniellales bacterium]|nr:hypothetical protein [Kiloniellales bacterium]
MKQGLLTATAATLLLIGLPSLGWSEDSTMKNTQTAADGCPAGNEQQAMVVGTDGTDGEDGEDGAGTKGGEGGAAGQGGAGGGINGGDGGAGGDGGDGGDSGTAGTS